MPPTPARGRTFRFRDRALDLRTGEASFTYDLDGEVLTERLVFDRPVATELIEVTRRAYDDGLRELAVVNRLPVPLETEIDAEVIDRGEDGGVPEASCSRPLLPIGGG